MIDLIVSYARDFLKRRRGSTRRTIAVRWDVHGNQDRCRCSGIARTGYVATIISSIGLSGNIAIAGCPGNVGPWPRRIGGRLPLEAKPNLRRSILKR